MRATTIISSLVLLAASSSAVTVSFDSGYDVKDASMTTVACSDGPNSLIAKGFTTFGSLPKFPYIGGSQLVTDFNTDKCGTCWALSFGCKTINILVIDGTESGFNIGERAMHDLTNGQAENLGVVNAVATQVASSVCGL